MTKTELEKKYDCNSVYTCKWNGYNIYDLDLKGCVGLPIYFLEKDGDFRETENLEGLEILDYQCKENIKNPFCD